MRIERKKRQQSTKFIFRHWIRQTPMNGGFYSLYNFMVCIILRDSERQRVHLIVRYLARSFIMWGGTHGGNSLSLSSSPLHTLVLSPRILQDDVNTYSITGLCGPCQSQVFLLPIYLSICLTSRGRNISHIMWPSAGCVHPRSFFGSPCMPPARIEIHPPNPHSLEGNHDRTTLFAASGQGG